MPLPEMDVVVPVQAENEDDENEDHGDEDDEAFYETLNSFLPQKTH
jgi:hypothetical protein